MKASSACPAILARSDRAEPQKRCTGGIDDGLADLVFSAAHTEGWHRERWGTRIWVPAVTLDQLIDRHGEPRFDVGGFEDKALAGCRDLCGRSPSSSR